MVNRRLWFRSGPHASRPMSDHFGVPSPEASSLGIDEEVDPSTPTPGLAPAAGPEREGRRLLFINQYYWPDHASTAEHELSPCCCG